MKDTRRVVAADAIALGAANSLFCGTVGVAPRIILETDRLEKATVR